MHTRGVNHRTERKEGERSEWEGWEEEGRDRKAERGGMERERERERTPEEGNRGGQGGVRKG